MNPEKENERDFSLCEGEKVRLDDHVSIEIANVRAYSVEIAVKAPREIKVSRIPDPHQGEKE